MVGYQGEPGAYSEEAAEALFPGQAATGFRTFRLAFDALLAGEAEACVLPVENSLGGIIQEVNDYLWEFAATPLRVTGEHVLPVRHCLLGRHGDDVERALSHPQALAQCRGWLHAHHIAEVVGEDTAGSARWLAANPTPGLAAIASAAAGRRYGLDVLAEGIQDDDSNRTRFLVVTRGLPERPAGAGAGARCSLAFRAAHRPGSLVSALRHFADRGVNLSRLDSRPVAGRPFEYRFYLDFETGADPAAAESALAALDADAAEVRLFGSYPIA